MLDAATARDHAPGSSPLGPECSAIGHASSRGSQGDGGVEQSVGDRDAHGNYYQDHGPKPTITFSAEDYTNAEQRAETYRRTYGVRVDGVNTAWTRWVWAGERKVFEVWGALTEREWHEAWLAEGIEEGRRQRAAWAASQAVA